MKMNADNVCDSDWEDEFSIGLDPVDGLGKHIIATLKEALEDLPFGWVDCSAKIYWEYERKGYPQYGPIHKSISPYQNSADDSVLLTVTARVPSAKLDVCDEFHELVRVSALEFAQRGDKALQAAAKAKQEKIEALKEEIRKLEES